MGIFILYVQPVPGMRNLEIKSRIVVQISRYGIKTRIFGIMNIDNDFMTFDWFFDRLARIICIDLLEFALEYF